MEKLKYNTRGKRVAGSIMAAPCYIGQYRLEGAKRWKSLKTNWHMLRDANVEAIEHVGKLGGVCVGH